MQSPRREHFSPFSDRGAPVVRVVVVLLPALIAGFAASCAQSSSSRSADATHPPADDPGKLGAVTDVQARLAQGIAGTSHDFTHGTGRPLDLCTPCHTPHLAAARPPLLDKRPETLAVLRPYQSLGIELDESTLLCLSCHDGVTARDVFSFAHATRGADRLGTSWVGTGTLQSHPVGVNYPLAEGKYVPVSGVTSDGRIRLPGGRSATTRQIGRATRRERV